MLLPSRSIQFGPRTFGLVLAADNSVRRSVLERSSHVPETDEHPSDRNYRPAGDH